jgi:SAM-dependent methyltransferase
MTPGEHAAVPCTEAKRSRAQSLTCPVCQRDASWFGSKQSEFSGRVFNLARCHTCRYAFIIEPRTDFDRLYDDAYYSGRGADLHVDYEREMSDPRTIREYEWRGVVRSVETLVPVSDETRWLDFGAGLGGLVRYGRSLGIDVVGYDQGYAAQRMQDRQIPCLTGLEEAQQTFDIVTAIEVIEHSVDPIADLRTMALLLRPGGLLYLATGNAAPHRAHLEDWTYLAPIDVHVGVFEPETLAHALRRAGLEPEWPGYLPGHTDIIRHKVLKALGLSRRHTVERFIPWPLASRIVDSRHRVSGHPVGRKITSSQPA